MERIAVFPGSFDPFTVGHESIVRRATSLFDKIYIAIGYNFTKKGFFSLDQRIKFINGVFKNEDNIRVSHFTGLTIDFCKKVDAGYLLRGLRTSADFEYERAIGQLNKALNHNIETVFLLTRPEHTFIQSTIVRDIILNGGDASQFLPEGGDLNILKETQA